MKSVFHAIVLLLVFTVCAQAKGPVQCRIDHSIKYKPRNRLYSVYICDQDPKGAAGKDLMYYEVENDIFSESYNFADVEGNFGNRVGAACKDVSEFGCPDTIHVCVAERDWKYYPDIDLAKIGCGISASVMNSVAARKGANCSAYFQKVYKIVEGCIEKGRNHVNDSILNEKRTLLSLKKKLESGSGSVQLANGKTVKTIKIGNTRWTAEDVPDVSFMDAYKTCPAGWHIPMVQDWADFQTHMEKLVGQKVSSFFLAKPNSEKILVGKIYKEKVNGHYDLKALEDVVFDIGDGFGMNLSLPKDFYGYNDPIDYWAISPNLKGRTEIYQKSSRGEKPSFGMRTLLADNYFLGFKSRAFFVQEERASSDYVEFRHNLRCVEGEYSSSAKETITSILQDYESQKTLVNYFGSIAGSFVDKKTSEEYATVQFGSTKWMAENVRGKKAKSFDPCPKGWDLPNEQDAMNYSREYQKTNSLIAQSGGEGSLDYLNENYCIMLRNSLKNSVKLACYTGADQVEIRKARGGEPYSVRCMQPAASIKPESFGSEEQNESSEKDYVTISDIFGSLSATPANVPDSIDVPVLVTPFSAKASATSEPTKKNSYDASNMLNANPATAWAAPFTGDPIRLSFKVPNKKIDAVYIENGYWKDEKSLRNNGRIKKAVVYINGSPTDTISVEDVSAPPASYEADKNGLTLNLKESHPDVTNIDIEILDIYPGAKWETASITSVKFVSIERQEKVTEPFKFSGLHYGVSLLAGYAKPVEESYPFAEGKSLGGVDLSLGLDVLYFIDSYFALRSGLSLEILVLSNSYDGDYFEEYTHEVTDAAFNVPLLLRVFVNDPANSKRPWVEAGFQLSYVSSSTASTLFFDMDLGAQFVTMFRGGLGLSVLMNSTLVDLGLRITYSFQDYTFLPDDFGKMVAVGIELNIWF